MNLLNAIKIGASGLTAERTRLNVASMNLANANVTRTIDGGPYVPRSVVFTSTPVNDDSEGLSASTSQVGLAGSAGLGAGPKKLSFEDSLKNVEARLHEVKVTEVKEDKFPFKEVYDPAHPDADERGIVRLPNVNVMEQMVDIMSASRAYEAGVTSINTAKTMAMKALEIGR